MIRFVQRPTGEVFRVLLESEQGLWLISHQEPAAPLFVTSAEGLERIETPASFLEARQYALSEAERKRLALIQPLVDDEQCITDKSHRLKKVKETSASAGTTTKRVLRIFYRYLARGELGSHLCRGKKKHPDFDWAIQKFYFSAKRLSLRATYDMMLVQKYTDNGGQLREDAPSWSSFQRYFYSNDYHKKPEKVIAREGLSHYQRNCRPAFGDAATWRSQPGAYQMDATEADIYLVSRFDRTSVIGRPYIYMAVDTATQIIAGVYVGLEAGELAVLKALENAAMDKVQFCQRHGIEITPNQWPNTGVPMEIITDKGRDFCSERIKEFCARYGIEMQSLPPFRPDQKSAVEKSFDLLQSRYKPLLRGKGVVEDDAQERWSTDYRSQAVLNLDEFATIVIHCVIYLNSGRLLATGKTPAQTWLDTAPSLLTVNMEELHCFTLPRTTSKLSRKGIAYNGMTYVPDISTSPHIGEKHEIAVDPTDSSHIFIVGGGQFYRANLSSKFDQFQRLSVSEIQALKRAQQKDRQVARQSEISASVAATHAVQTIIQTAELRREDIQGGLTGEEIAKNREAERRRLT